MSSYLFICLLISLFIVLLIKLLSWNIMEGYHLMWNWDCHQSPIILFEPFIIHNISRSCDFTLSFFYSSSFSLACMSFSIFLLKTETWSHLVVLVLCENLYLLLLFNNNIRFQKKIKMYEIWKTNEVKK